MDKRDESISAMCKPSIGEAGRTGDWRDLRPVIDHSKCTPSVKKKAACYLCWLYCPEGVVKAGIPIEIDLEYCKGCGICADAEGVVCDGYDGYMEMRCKLQSSLEKAPETICAVSDEFAKVFARDHGGMLWSYRSEDADVILSTMG